MNSVMINLTKQSNNFKLLGVLTVCELRGKRYILSNSNGPDLVNTSGGK